MRRLSWWIVAASLAGVGTGAGGTAARAEENRIALHLEVGPLLTLVSPSNVNAVQAVATAGAHVGIAAEYAVHERLGIELLYAPDTLFAQFGGAATLQQHLAAGVRVRPWYSSGYLLPRKKDAELGAAQLLSDFWIDLHAGVALANVTNSFGVDAAVGTRVPIIAPLQAGLYVRYQHLFAFSNNVSGAYGQLTVGIEASVGFLPVHSEPDSDHDGVPDSKDRCANSPDGSDVNDVGCPVSRDVTPPPRCSDTDLDGVCDGSDDCADTPLGTAVDKKGCPTAVESDKPVEIPVP